MKRLDETAKGILYVCDKNGVLQGSITDGDIRRFIINTGRLDTVANSLMKENPITVYERDSLSSEQVIKKYLVRSVPIIDQDGHIVDIKFLENYEILSKHKKKIDVPVAIMAGGKGVRLQPYTNILPKPLIPIGEKTITEHIIEHFEDAGCSRFSMIVNYKKHFIKAYYRDNEIKRNIDFVDEKDFYGTAGGLRLLIDKYKETFFVSN